MKVVRVDTRTEDLLAPDHASWVQAGSTEFPLVPTPLKGNPAIRAISPFIEKSTDHGTVNAVSVSAAHNGSVLAIRLSWAGAGHDRIADLDQFVDGVAVMFPLTPNASAVTMGSPTDPVNAWYWKGNLEDAAFDVIATGYGTSGRQRDPALPVHCRARHGDGRWQVVLARELDGGADRAVFRPGEDAAMAFAVWDGGNRERAGRKSFSGDFVRIPVEA